MKPKVRLNLEYKDFLGGIFYKNVGTGVLSSYKNQKKILEKMGVEYIENGKEDYDILQVNLMGPKALYLIRRDKKRGKKIVTYAHNTPEDFVGVFWFSNLVLPIFTKLVLYMHSKSDVIICPSEYTKDLMTKHGAKSPMIALSNAVDTERFNFDQPARDRIRKKYGLKNITVFSVGLVVARKSPITMIKMAEKFSGADLIWFGKIYSRFLAKKLPQKMPSNIQFTGYVATQDIVGAFSAGDIFVFPSHEENEGMVILEAAAVGRPLVVRDIPVYKGWLMHGENCFKAKDQSEFEKYVDMLTKDKQLREKMGQEALALAKRNNLENIGKKLLEIYDGLPTG